MNGDLLICGRSLDSFFSSPSLCKADYAAEDVMSALACNRGAMRYQRLMTTRSGRLGLAPGFYHHENQPERGVHQGDQICILLNCSFPLIIRPNGFGHQLIGSCYVHGIMDGEALENLKAGVCHLQDITFS